MKPGSGWSGTLTENAKLSAAGAAVPDYYGAAVALEGGLGIAGSPRTT